MDCDLFLGSSGCTISTYLNIAMLFLSTDTITAYISSLSVREREKAKSILVCSPNKIETEESIEKSLTMLCSENGNFEIFKILEEKGFDVSDLGEFCVFDRDSKVKNKMVIWYWLLKYLLDSGYHKFVYQITRYEKIMEGPTIMGALVTAAKEIQPDLKFFEKIAQYFHSEWYYKAKFQGMTAHNCLLRERFNKKMISLGSNACVRSKTYPPTHPPPGGV